LRSVCAAEETDPLAEDWNWSAPSMLALLDLTRQFGQAYRAAKRDAGGIDFTTWNNSPCNCCAGGKPASRAKSRRTGGRSCG